MGKKWTSADIGDMSGRVMLITGANSGLGLESAKAMAGHGARVLMAGRDPDKLAAAQAVVGGDSIPVRLDLADLASVRAAAAEVARQTDRLDVLMNNAGVMATPFGHTVDGFETQIGTNHLGPFALTGLLLPLLREGRVVTVSSAVHRAGEVDPDDLSFENRRYSPWPAYAQSKVANLLFTSELARRAKAAGWPLIAAAAHPGWAATNLQYAGPSFAQNRVGRLLTSVANRVASQSAEAGAWPQEYAAVAVDVNGDDYFGPDGLGEQRGHPQRVGRTAHSLDPDLARRLWERSEELTAVTYDWS